MAPYDINRILMDSKEYLKTIDGLKNEILVKDFNERKTEIIVKVNSSKVKLNKSEFLISLIMAKPYNSFKMKIEQETDLFLGKITSGNINGYISSLIIKFRQDFNSLKDDIVFILENLGEVASKASMKYGTTISLYNIIHSGFKNPEIFDIINTNIPENLEFYEIEDYINVRQKRLIEILKNDKASDLYAFFNSESGINSKQFEEVFVSLGLKADINGNIIPSPVNTNLVRGFRDVNDFYINSISARKALILTFSNVKSSGYFTRKLSLLQIDETLDESNETCNSVHYLNIYIASQKTFNRIVGRIYFNEKTKEEEVITPKIAKDIIKTTIKMRSPITCASKNVCKRCYGPDLANLNNEVHVGLLAVLILTNQLTQRLLSAKHLLSTKSKKVEWPPEFKDNFMIDCNNIKSKNLEGNFISFKIISEKNDSNRDIYKVNKFKILDNINKKETKVDLGLSFIPTENFLNFLRESKNKFIKNNRYIIPLKSVKESMFTINVENNELGHILKNILNLIESKKFLDIPKNQNFNNLFNSLMVLIDESNLNLNSVHMEMILRSLVRKSSDLTKRIDFSKENLHEYKILRVSNAVLNSKSVSTSLVFERIKGQLTNIRTYSKKKYSVIDELIK